MREVSFYRIALAVCVSCCVWTSWCGRTFRNEHREALAICADLENGYQALAAAVFRVDEKMTTHIDADADWKLSTDEEEQILRNRLSDLERQKVIILNQGNPVKTSLENQVIDTVGTVNFDNPTIHFLSTASE